MLFRQYSFVGIAIVLLVALFFRSAAGVSRGKAIQIGIPDGAAGLIARYVLDEKMNAAAVQGVRYTPYPLYDCCASATQYAMGSGHLDVAFLCPDAARVLIEKDRRFEIAGPVVMNSDIFIFTFNVDEPDHPQIAISQKREFQRQMVTQRYGKAGRAVPMFHGAVPFAFARGVVQGAIVDITKAFALEGVMEPASEQGNDVPSYVMVVKKALRTNSDFHRFLTAYETAVNEMADTDSLFTLLQRYVSVNITQGDVIQWKRMNVRFTCPSSFLQQE